MNKTLILTERENILKYISLLLVDFSEEELDLKLRDWDKKMWRESRRITQALSDTVYLADSQLLKFADNSLQFRTPLVTPQHLGEETLNWSIVILLNKLVEFQQEAFDMMSVEQTVQYIFNKKHTLKVSLQKGFPAIEIEDGYFICRGSWERYTDVALYKALHKFEHYYRIFLTNPNNTAAIQTLNYSYGMLNKAVAKLTVEDLMNIRYPKLMEVAQC